MLDLFLLRHAKSDWNSHDGDDFTRNISKTGIIRTHLITNLLHQKKIKIEEILCSPSLRTRRTLDIIEHKLNLNCEVKFVDNLYHLSHESIFDVVVQNSSKRSVMVISHEPKLSQAIPDFSNESENKFFIQSQQKFPTSGLFHLRFDTKRWYEISKSNSCIINFVKPNDLV